SMKSSWRHAAQPGAEPSCPVRPPPCQRPCRLRAGGSPQHGFRAIQNDLLRAPAYAKKAAPRMRFRQRQPAGRARHTPTVTTMPRCAPPQPSDAPAAPPFVWTDLATSDVEQPAAMQQHWMPMRYDQVDRGRFAGRYRQLDVDGML